MDITYPVGFFPFVDGGTALGSQIVSLLADDANPSKSLSVLNGNIDKANLDSAFRLEDIHTQRGALVNIWSSSANANADYRAQDFGGHLFDQGAPGEQYQIPTLTTAHKFFIAGASVTRFFPWPKNIVVAIWQVYWNAQIDNDQLAKIFLHVDGQVYQPVSGFRPDSRNVSHVSPDIAGEVDNYSTNNGYLKARAWTGHFATRKTDLIAGGWHSVGLGIMCDPHALMTRVHARAIVVMALKGPE